MIPEAHASHVECEVAAAGTRSRPSDPGAKEQLALEAQYIELYLMKYICTAPECYGTFVPQECGEPGGVSGGRMTCNVCGHQRSEEEFRRDVQKLLQESAE